MLRTLTLATLAAVVALSATVDDVCPCPAMAEDARGTPVEVDRTEATADTPPPCHGDERARTAQRTTGSNDGGVTTAATHPTDAENPCPCDHGETVPSCCCPGCPAAQGTPLDGHRAVHDAALPARPEGVASSPGHASPAAGPRAPSAAPLASALPPPRTKHAPTGAVGPPPDLTVRHQVFRI